MNRHPTTRWRQSFFWKNNAVKERGFTRPRRLGKTLGIRGNSRERLHKQPCKGEQLKTANQTPAGSPTGQDERERTRQRAGSAEGGEAETGDWKWGRREFLAEARKARRKTAPQAEDNLAKPEVTPPPTPRTPAQKRASTPARLARMRLEKIDTNRGFIGATGV